MALVPFNLKRVKLGRDRKSQNSVQNSDGNNRDNSGGEMSSGEIANDPINIPPWL